MDDLKFSICIPTYNMGRYLKRTLEDVFAQSYGNFEIVISDNASTDNTGEIVTNIFDPRLRYFKNEKNLGYSANLDLCKQRASGDIIYLLSAKSRISRDALKKTYQAFMLDEDIGVVTRPYYWFAGDINQPVRAKESIGAGKIAVLTNESDVKEIIKMFHTLDNPAGLAFRRKWMDQPFGQDAFVEFTYPFARILKYHKVAVLGDYVMACPAFSYSGSQDKRVYDKSPMQCWIDMFNTVFSEPEFKSLRKTCIRDFVAVNYIGLVQIRNYARRYSFLLREIGLLLKYRPKNLLNPKFWFFVFVTMLVPKFLLKRLVVWYKKGINGSILKDRVSLAV